MNAERLINVSGYYNLMVGLMCSEFTLLLQSANYVRTELPTRLAHRIRDMQTLPFVVVTQEMVAKVYEVSNFDLY